MRLLGSFYQDKYLGKAKVSIFILIKLLSWNNLNNVSVRSDFCYLKSTFKKKKFLLFVSKTSLLKLLFCVLPSNMPSIDALFLYSHCRPSCSCCGWN